MFFHKVARNLQNLIFNIKKWKIGKSRRIAELKKVNSKCVACPQQGSTNGGLF